MVRNTSQRQDFVLTGKGIQLKEVSVRAPKISQRNDTLSYLVSAFADQSDRSIGDVLKKMPGIEVDESGNISYNGKAISHFYVEGMDLLQGRYGLGSRESGGDSFFADDIWKNRLRYDTWQGGLQQSYSYNNDPFSAELLLPLFYQRLCVNDRLAAERKSHDKPMIMPRLTLRYKLDNWKASCASDRHSGNLRCGTPTTRGSTSAKASISGR